MGNYIRQWILWRCALICKPPTIPSSPVLSFHLYSSSWENTFLFCIALKSTFLGAIIGIYIYQHKKESNESETYKVCFVWQGYDMMIKHEIQCLLISVKLLYTNNEHGPWHTFLREPQGKCTTSNFPIDSAAPDDYLLNVQWALSILSYI